MPNILLEMFAGVRRLESLVVVGRGGAVVVGVGVHSRARGLSGAWGEDRVGLSGAVCWTELVGNAVCVLGLGCSSVRFGYRVPVVDSR